jgi:hypothetical protein
MRLRGDGEPDGAEVLLECREDELRRLDVSRILSPLASSVHTSKAAVQCDPTALEGCRLGCSASVKRDVAPKSAPQFFRGMLNWGASVGGQAPGLPPAAQQPHGALGDDQEERAEAAPVTPSRELDIGSGGCRGELAAAALRSVLHGNPLEVDGVSCDPLCMRQRQCQPCELATRDKYRFASGISTGSLWTLRPSLPAGQRS